MAFSPFGIMVVYQFSMLIGWTACQSIQWREVRRLRYVPTLYCVVSATGVAIAFTYSVMMAPDCYAAPACQQATGVVAMVLDALMSVTYSFLLLKRMVILVDEGVQRWLRALYVVPVTYPLADLMVILTIVGAPATMEWGETFYFAYNVLFPANCLAIDCLLLYSLAWGTASVRFARNAPQKRALARKIAFSCVGQVVLAAFGFFYPDICVALVYVFANWNNLIYRDLNQLIVDAYQAGGFGDTLAARDPASVHVQVVKSSSGIAQAALVVVQKSGSTTIPSQPDSSAGGGVVSGKLHPGKPEC